MKRGRGAECRGGNEEIRGAMNNVGVIDAHSKCPGCHPAVPVCRGSFLSDSTNWSLSRCLEGQGENNIMFSIAPFLTLYKNSH